MFDILIEVVKVSFLEILNNDEFVISNIRMLFIFNNL